MINDGEISKLSKGVKGVKGEDEGEQGWESAVGGSLWVCGGARTGGTGCGRGAGVVGLGA